MIRKIYIKNFKIFPDEDIILNDYTTFVGTNDSGKSSILQAIDFFMNQEKIDKLLIPNTNENVEIGLLIGENFYKKVFKKPTFKFSLELSSDNLSEMEQFNYIYISDKLPEIDKIIEQFSVAKLLESINVETKTYIEEKVEESVQECLDSINPDFVIGDNDMTILDAETTIDYSKLVKFKINSNGVPLVGRGSGFRKTLLYSLLINNRYENTVIAIDEIENSLTISNSNELMSKLHDNFSQALVSTHSRSIAENNSVFKEYALYGNSNINSVIDLYDKLHPNYKNVILVEGKYDIHWFNKVLELKNINDFVVIPSGGGDIDGNMRELEIVISSMGYNCLKIVDGDMENEFSLERECVELYTNTDAINNVFSIIMEEIPTSKDVFFTLLTNEDDHIGDRTIKSRLSLWAKDNLNERSEFVVEVFSIITNFISGLE